MPLDLTQPYGTIQGDTLGRAFQQNGVTYKRDGTVWSAPSTYVENIAAMKVNGSGSVVGLVRPDGTEATLAGGGEGGATEFTQLSDAPMTITPNAILFGNTAGDAVAFVPNVIYEPDWNGLTFKGLTLTPTTMGPTSLCRQGMVQLPLASQRQSRARPWN